MATDHERTVSELDEIVAEQLPRQVLDRDRDDDGGQLSLTHGVATAAGTSGFIANLGHAYLSPESRYFEVESIRDRILRAIDFERRSQRPSGCIDLLAANFDSPPDTAFAVARVAPVLRIARRRPNVAGAERIADALEPFLEDAAEGMAAGGFHTPNHRWVLVCALGQAYELFHEEALLDRIEEYLAEGIDINDDGEYSERSHGIYTHVVNRHLVGAAEALDRPALLDPVRRSLHTVMDLMDADWTVVTGLSSRRDREQRAVPIRGAAEFYFAARSDGDERLAAGARGLLDAGGWEHASVLRTLLSYFDRHPDWTETQPIEGEREDSLERSMPDSGVWRFREGRLAATAAAGTKNIVSLSYGEARLAGLQLTSPYFGGEFEGEGIEFGEDDPTVRVGAEYWHGSLPGYFEPLDRPVAWGERELDTREVDQVPDFDIEVRVERVPGGLDATVSVSGGLDRVPFALEARFVPGGRIEFASGSAPGTAGQASFLESGHAIYRVDGDAVRIGPGSCEHEIADPPGVDDPSEVARVLITDWAPFERTVEIRGDEWPAMADIPAGPASDR